MKCFSQHRPIMALLVFFLLGPWSLAPAQVRSVNTILAPYFDPLQGALMADSKQTELCTYLSAILQDVWLINIPNVHAVVFTSL
jgi:hypothetical protein